MAPPKRNRRLVVFFGCAVLAIAGVILLITALRSNTQFFHSPSAVTRADFIPKSEIFRIGGMVVPGTLKSESGTHHSFSVADFEAEPDDKPLSVQYSGVLPDLFGEGEGVVVSGSLDGRGAFVADKVLAKHDNEYVPKLPQNGT
ncbi:cytochrome c maturation protein CcmE [Robiginitomaculum antarcticum]|uniref:cytochrome c maturation protein CcmE n=1 Tax=Robiginitomaculum antarcticum TaxID=437507 RepID=UPI000526A24C|nr:cytochrome c maturation protein CcmE [Robiginitomaculum antarcticum]